MPGQRAEQIWVLAILKELLCRLNRGLTRLTELLWRVAQKQNRKERSLERLATKTRPLQRLGRWQRNL